MNRNRELFVNTIYFAIGNLGSKIISFIMVPLYTLWLRPDEYGVVDLIQSYNNILLLIVGLGIADALVVFPINKPEEIVKKHLSTAFLFHLLFIFVFFLFYWLAAFFKFRILDSINDLLWFSYALLISATTSRLFQAYCKGIRKMKVFSYVGIIQALSIALLSYFLIPKLAVHGYLYAIIISNVVTIAFTLIYSKAYKNIRINYFSRPLLKEMLQYSLPLIPNSIMWWFILSLNRPLLERFSGIAAVGIIAVAGKLPTLIDMFYNFFHQSWIATIVQEYEKPDFSKYYNKVFDAVVAVQSLVCFVVMFFSKYIVDLFIDNRYIEAWDYIPFMCLTVVVSNIATFTTSVFSAAKKTTYIFYSVIFASTVSVFLNFMLIPRFGIWGALVSVFFSHFIAAISRIAFGWSYVKINNVSSLLYNILLCIMACGAVMYLKLLLQVLCLVTLLAFWCKYNKNVFLAINIRILNKRKL